MPSGSASPDPEKDSASSPAPSRGWAGGIPAGRIFGVPLVVSPAWVLLVVLGMLVVPAGLRQHVKGRAFTGGRRRGGGNEVIALHGGLFDTRVG